MKQRRLLPARGVELLEGRIFDAEFEDTPPAEHRWTFDDYSRISEAGLLGRCRTELINGGIVDMAPQRNLHWIGVAKTHQALQRIFNHPYVVGSQGTHRFSRDFGPEPDVIVLPHMPASRGYEKPPPLLVVEICDTTLEYDRGPKASLYAAHGVEDYWIVNLIDRCVEVHRKPGQEKIPGKTEDETSASSWQYATRVTVFESAKITPLAEPGASVAVKAMLP